MQYVFLKYTGHHGQKENETHKSGIKKVNE